MRACVEGAPTLSPEGQQHRKAQQREHVARKCVASASLRGGIRRLQAGVACASVSAAGFGVDPRVRVARIRRASVDRRQAGTQRCRFRVDLRTGQGSTSSN